LGLHVTSSIHSRPDSRFALREISLWPPWSAALVLPRMLKRRIGRTGHDAAVQVAALKEIVVSGSRNEQSVEDIPQTIDVINAADIEQGQIRDIRDAAKKIPNVSVRRAPARFGLAQGDTGREGNAGFNIRGLDGNRVLMMVDGIRIPRSYAFSPNSFGRDSLSIDLIKRIEIVKGPASALYGSDGIAGLVNFITNEPDDYLKDGKTLGGRASIGYSGDNSETAVSGTIAGRATRHAGLAAECGHQQRQGAEKRATTAAPALPEPSRTRKKTRPIRCWPRSC
jgi:hemoglobin/transferrin/lactoferrin receptor protein